MAIRIAGCALAVGTSLNRRVYSARLIERAVAGAQRRIAEGRMLMCSNHAAAEADDALRVVGRVRAMSVDPTTGAALYEGELVDTQAGRDIAALLAGQPHVAVSIRGRYLGPVRTELGEGGTTLTVPAEGTDLDLEGLDITTMPGSVGASARLAEHRRDPALVTESATAVEVVDVLQALDVEQRRQLLAEHVYGGRRGGVVESTLAGAPDPTMPTLAALGVRDVPLHELTIDEFRCVSVARTDLLFAQAEAARAARPSHYDIVRARLAAGGSL